MTQALCAHMNNNNKKTWLLKKVKKKKEVQRAQTRFNQNKTV
jgi:hypothetical protein